MNNKEMVDYIESMVSELVGEDIRGAGVYENEEVTISLGGEQTQATTEEESLPVEPEGVPEEDFSNEKTSEAIYTTADKEHLDFLYGVFGSMDEARLKALASDLENAAIGNAKIELTTETDKDRFLACLDKLAMDEEAEASELSAIDDVLDEVFSTDIKQYIYLLPTNPNAIKRAFYGRFNDDLTDEDINSLCACVDEAIGDGVLNTDTVNIVREAFLNTEFVATLTDEQIELASQAIDDAVYDEEDLVDAFVRVIQAKLTDAVEDDSKILACREEIRSVIEQVMALRSVSDIDADITNYLQNLEETQEHIDTASTAFKTAAGPYITTDNVESVLTALFDAISGFTDEETRDEISNIVKSSVFASTYSISRAKDDIKRSITEYTYANKIEAEEIETIKLAFKQAVGESLSLENLNVSIANFESIIAKVITAEQLNAAKATIREATIDTLYVNTLNAKLAVIEQAIIDTLDAKIANINVANIDFANINLAQVEKIFSKAGVISDLTTETGTITGELVGVTISGDLIEANTLKADKLVVLGSDGLYYKLNVSGETVESQQTDYNSINGSNIQAKTITASKINVTDLVAFGAKIGGLTIENGGIHSDGKTIDNNQAGIYMDSQGQFNTGDGQSFIKSYYDETDQKWKVKIQSDLLYFSTGRSISAAVDKVDELNQHFWFDTTGAHISETSREDYIEDPSSSGGNAILNTDGLKIMNGVTELSTFTKNGATIGKTDETESYMALDYHSLKLIDKEGRNYLFISDLRDRDGEAILKEYITVQPNQSEIDTSMGVDRVISAKNYETDKDLTSACEVYEVGAAKVWLSKTLSTEFTLELEYATSSTRAKAFTFGSRDELSTIGLTSTAFGDHVTASGILSFAEGASSIASGKVSHAEGESTTASGENSHAEGKSTTASGYNSHAEGFNTEAAEMYSHAEGNSTKATNNAAHAEGLTSTAEGYYSHAEGKSTTASGQASHAEGENTTAGDVTTHAEGYYSAAYGTGSHAEGYSTNALADYTHAEGHDTIARGFAAHAEGYNTKTEGHYSHAQNNGTIAKRASQTAIGEYNIEDSGGASVSERGNYAVIVGNGTSKDARSNALTVDWNGNVNASGNVNATDVTASGSVNAATSVNVGGTNILELVYPVGSIYMSVNATDPGTLFGGTWTRIEDRFLLAAGSTYAAGGADGQASVSYTPAGTVGNHTLTTTEIPAHTHGSKTLTGDAQTYSDMGILGAKGSGTGIFSKGALVKNTAGPQWRTDYASYKLHVNATHTHDSVGGGGAHNHPFTGTAATIKTMPPYLTVYMWKRTA